MAGATKRSGRARPGAVRGRQTRRRFTTAVAAEAAREGRMSSRVPEAKPEVPQQQEVRAGDADVSVLEAGHVGDVTPGGATPEPDQSDVDEIVLKRYYDIGAAGGLVVPVLRDADRLGLADIGRRIEDIQGGTFSVTNGGVFGSLLSTPILNPPQVGILELHRIEERPVSVDGRVTVRPMMHAALSYDHRIVDGREAVGFLGEIKRLVEDPEELLLHG